MNDLYILWKTRHSSGFPWPFQIRSLHELLLGYPSWSPVPIWKQVMNIPLRPYRYVRMVRNIARVRNHPYTPYIDDMTP